MTTIEKIKAEIERRKGQAKEHYNEPYSIGRCDAFSEMLNFIDSLEEKSEKPMQGLEEEIVKVCDDFAFPLYGLDDEFGRELINKIARHFAEWGAEHAKECEECPSRGNTHSYLKGLEDGKKEMKEQMMKEAVETKVFMSFAPGHNQMVMADVDLPTNTKVRIIIVKE